MDNAQTIPRRAADRSPELGKGGNEQRIGLYSCVLNDNGRIRIWCRMERGLLSPELRVGYEELEDEIIFTKPELGLHEVDGSTANHEVISGERTARAAVWIDGHASAEHGYKTQTRVYPSGLLRLHSSPDAIHWSPFAAPRIGHVYTQKTVSWDPREERYLMFTRRWLKNEQVARYRTVRRLDADDPNTCESERVVLQPDERNRTIHERPQPRTLVNFNGGRVFRYEAAYHTYFMFAQST